MKAIIIAESAKSTVTYNFVLRGKEETKNQKIADEVVKIIKKELAVGRSPHSVTVRIMENNRIVNKWIYKPTIR